MYRGIIGLVEGDPEGRIQSNRGSTDVEAELVETVVADDGRLVSGKAVAMVEYERDVPSVGDDYITTNREVEMQKQYVEFLANLSDGWVTIDTSDGEFLWDFLEHKHRVQIKRAEIDLDALSEEIRGWERASVWQSQSSWGDSEDPASESGVTIAYHDDAGWPEKNIGQLGFSARWNGGNIRGTLAKSGYVSLFSGGTEETAAAFISDVLMSHCSIPDDEQEFLAEEL